MLQSVSLSKIPQKTFAPLSLLPHVERSDVRGAPTDCDDNVSGSTGSREGPLCRRECGIGERGHPREGGSGLLSKNVMSYFL